MKRVRWSDIRVTRPSTTIAEALPRGEAYFLLTEFKDLQKRKKADTIRVILISPRLGRLLVWLYARRLTDFDLCFLRKDGSAWTRNSIRCRWRRMRAALRLVGDIAAKDLFRITGVTQVRPGRRPPASGVGSSPTCSRTTKPELQRGTCIFRLRISLRL